MGFDAIWISPISANIGATSSGEAYHGYVPRPLPSMNPKP